MHLGWGRDNVWIKHLQLIKDSALDWTCILQNVINLYGFPIFIDLATVTPTSPPRNKSITVEATFDITFKKEYLNKSSEAYEDLERNFKRVLNETFFELKGYLGVEILSFRNGSVVCEFNVIFKETANSEVGKVKETLQKASGSKKLGGYAVTNIKIDDGKISLKSCSKTLMRWLI